METINLQLTKKELALLWIPFEESLADLEALYPEEYEKYLPDFKTVIEKVLLAYADSGLSGDQIVEHARVVRELQNA